MHSRHVLLTAVLLSASALVTLAPVCGSPSGVATQPPVTTAARSETREPFGAKVPVATVETSLVSFDEFPVLWLGESFDSNGDGVGDMPLTAAMSEVSPNVDNPYTGTILKPEIRYFYMVYGDCTPAPGVESCHDPVAMAFYPPDSAVLSYADSLRSGQAVPIRGVNASFSHGVLWIETADFLVNISVAEQPGSTAAEQLRMATRVANELRGANAKASAISDASDFRPLERTPTSSSSPLPPTPTATAIIAAPTPGGAPLAPGSATIAVTAPGGAHSLNTPFVVTDSLASFAPGNGATWAGWELELAYDPGVLAVDSVTRGSLCPASAWANPAKAPHVVTGCAFQASTAIGVMETITFRCIANGTSALTLLGRDDPARSATGTALFDGNGADFATTLNSASVTCGSG